MRISKAQRDLLATFVKFDGGYAPDAEAAHQAYLLKRRGLVRWDADGYRGWLPTWRGRVVHAALGKAKAK